MTRIGVIPCSARKHEHRSPAGELYRGGLFRSARGAALALLERDELDDILVLSALHGLVELDRELEPYDVKMGDPEQVDALTIGRQLDELEAGEGDVELVPLLPQLYAAALEAAVESAELELYVAPNPLEGSRGILEQRRRLRELRTGERMLERVFSPAAPIRRPSPAIHPHALRDALSAGAQLDEPAVVDSAAAVIRGTTLTD